MTQKHLEAADPRLRSLDRHDKWLWAITFLLIIVQAAAILILYLPEVRGEWNSGYLVPESKGTLATGLCGLILLFCLYMLNKQAQMRRLRMRLAVERLQRAELSSRLEELMALFEVATRLNPRIPVEAYLQALVDRLVPAVQVAGACVYLRSRSGDGLACVAANGELVGAAGSDAVAASSPPFATVLAERTAVRGTARALDAVAFVSGDETQMLVLPVGLGEPTGALVLVRPRQPFLPHEDSLLRLFADHLSHDIERLTQVEQLEERATRLEATHRRQSEREREEWRFFASFHREIRSALASVAYRVEACERELATQPKAAAAHLSALAEEVRRLAAAVQEASALLDVDPMAEWILHAPVAVNAVVEGVLARVAPLAGTRGVALKPRYAPVLPLVGADATRLGRALVFYFSELLRRTPQGGSLEVATEPAPEGGVLCRVERRVEGGDTSAESAPRLPSLLLREIVEGTGGSCDAAWGPEGRGARLEFPVSSARGRVQESYPADLERGAA